MILQVGLMSLFFFSSFFLFTCWFCMHKCGYLLLYFGNLVNSYFLVIEALVIL